jgi:two-component system, NarL family, response regulator
MSFPLRILLVEDDELFRLGLRIKLQQEPTLDVVAEAEDGETALAWVQQQPLDIVLLDVGLPGMGGVETCRQIKQQQPRLPVLVLTSHSQPALITRLIEAGAQGYCQKGIGAETLILALRSLAAGASWWDSTATQEIRSTFDHQVPLAEPAAALRSLLTQRETEILGLLAAGKSNHGIAELLYITPGTVRVHVHAILHKLEVSDRAQAVIVARQKRLLPESIIVRQPLEPGC